MAEAVRGADIVTTVTADKRKATVLTPGMLVPGMHVNAVGGDCPGKTELHPGVLQQAAVFVEYAPQTRVEGDIQQMPADFPVTELWQVLTGAHPGRRDAAQLTVFDSVGFALEDYAALCFVRDAAERLGIGSTLALMPQTPIRRTSTGCCGPLPCSGWRPERIEGPRHQRQRRCAPQCRPA